MAASPAGPIEQNLTTLLVTEIEVRSVPVPTEPTRTGQLLFVTGNPLDDDRSSYPAPLHFLARERTVRLHATERDRIDIGDVLRIVNQRHTVYDSQPDHLVVDILTPQDREDDALIAVVRQNPHTPVGELKRIEALLRKAGSPYMDDGFRTLFEWEIAMVVRRSGRDSGDPFVESPTGTYELDFYPTTGRVNSEWTLRVDLKRSTVEEFAVWEEEPPPLPDE